MRELSLDEVPLQPAPLRPGWRFLLSHPAHLLAMGFGCGLSPVAPGTVGTLWAWGSFLVLQAWLSPFALGCVVLASVVLGWWASTVTVDQMRVLDPGAIVADEIMSFWLVLWVLMPAGWDEQLAAFVVFRLLDAVKPGPVGWADGLFHGFGWRGGLGIIFDDLVAAFCTLFLLAAWRHLP
jgi:phosphatidylglycerophosphatase A